MARVIAVHGWAGSPQHDWFPWLKTELVRLGNEVIVPEMPDSEKPNMHAWMAALTKASGKVDENTFFVGHSIGCQTILRYLAMNPSQGVAGGVVLVAPWTTLKPESLSSQEEKNIARPWIEMPIPWELAKKHSKKFVCFFSDNDEFVFVEDAVHFEQKLKAEIIIEHEMGHYSAGENVKRVPSVLMRLEKMMMG